jgi:hypothetical protein
MPDESTKSSLATSPLYALLDKDTSRMSREELTKFVSHLRTLRTSPPTFTKQLREDEEIADAVAASDSAKPKKSKTPKVLNADKFLADLEARANSKQ